MPVTGSPSVSRPLPAGRVTFLFTDVEGSTRLFHRLGGRFAGVLEDHRTILRSAFAAHGGVEVKTEGDGFFVAFADPAAAVAACLDAQGGMGEHDWPAGCAVRVRMGLHTGGDMVPTLDRDYLGLSVNQAARISSAGHGGQVLVSEQTASLAADRLPDGASLTDLGRYLLKDFDEPERIFCLAHPSLPDAFPALRAAPAATHNLPDVRTAFVGRGQELAQLEELLALTRMVTLVGPGGAGKTRLAVELADRLAGSVHDGVRMADLTAVTDPAQVGSAVAAALGVRESPGADPIQTAGRELVAASPVLLLDNCEHVLDAARDCADALLSAVPGLRILATSRERLRVPDEQVWPVAPLSVPASDAPAEELLAFDAIQLFLDRARLANARFALGEQNASHVAEICRRLEGLPLAIELAAARTAALSAEAIARRLSVGDARPGTADGPQERHRTTHATIDWSYRLLDAEGQRMLRGLSVFSGFTLEAAVAVAGDALAHDPVDALASLVDKSLVVWDDEMGRYRLLEPIRQFARAALEEAAEVDSVAGRHLRWFADLVDDFEAARGDQSRRFAELDHELGNIRAGVEWALQRDAAEGLRLSGPLTPYLEARGWMSEGRDWCERLLAAAPDAPPLHRGRALRLIAVCAWRAGDFAHAYERAREAVDLLHGVHDLAYLEALVSLGASAFGLNRLGEAREQHEAALEVAARIHAKGPRALILSALANILRVGGGPHEEVLRYAREALDASRSVGAPTLVVLSLCNLGHAEIDAGLPLAAARGRFAEALRTASDLGSPMHVAWGLDGMAKAFAQADPERAARLLGAVGALRTAHGMELEAPEQEDQDGVRARIEDGLGADRVAELIRAGSALEADAAVVLALA